MADKGKKDVDAALVRKALSARLLPEQHHEDPKRSEIHRNILRRTTPFRCPDKADEWRTEESELRRRFLREIYLRGHPADLLNVPPKTMEKGAIDTGAGYRIRKLLYEGYPGMWIPALLYEPTDLPGGVPGVLNLNGHHAGGKAMMYKQARCINLAKRGMLALSPEFIGMGELSMNIPHDRIAHLDLCGRAGVAIFYLAMKRGLDVLLSHPMCDPERVAVTGLSGGGWQTIVLSALDERVGVSVPVAGHSPIWQRPSSESDIGDLEQNPVDFCTVADYDTLTALRAPKPTLLIYNKADDCCFRSGRTKTSIYLPVEPLFALLGAEEMIEFHENVDPGTHNYGADNRSQLYRFLNRHFGLKSPEEDLPYEDEILSESQLEVGLPENNATFLSIAKDASKGLPLLGSAPKSRLGREKWIREARERLADIIRLQGYDLRDEVVAEEEGVTQHRFHLGGDWTVPATDLKPRERRDPPQILISDGGRVSLTEQAAEHLRQAREVLAADVFGTGESAYPSRYQMLLPAVGERPLGILTGQIMSLLEWLSTSTGERVRLEAHGPIVSFASLCATALNPGGVAHLQLEGLYDSLKRLIQLPVEYANAVPLFCFGLLREFDVPQLLAMAEGVQIERPGHGPVVPVDLH